MLGGANNNQSYQVCWAETPFCFKIIFVASLSIVAISLFLPVSYYLPSIAILTI